MAEVLADARRELARELGAEVEIVDEAPPGAPLWLVGPASANGALAALGPAPADGAYLVVDRARRLLVTDAPSLPSVWETFSLLRSLARMPDGVHLVGDCASVDEAIDLVVGEVGDCYPSFELRGVDWSAVCARNVERVRVADRPVEAIQAWLAELDDTHTWARPTRPPGHLPFEAWISPSREVVLTHVPEGSAAHEAGVRAGFRLIGEDVEAWWHRTAATPHAKPLVAARRLLEGAPGETRRFAAAIGSGPVVDWEETYAELPFEPVASWRRLASGAGYLRVRAWTDGRAIDAATDEALSACRDAPGLVVDLRGNGGGDVTLARRFRDRFLDRPARLGTIRTSVPGGGLSEPEPIDGEPAPEANRWRGPVRFLTDPLTYSSSEDALLGLQGLPHVEVLGEPSGGGSGRVRSLRLLPGWRLTVSTALTYDRDGRCVEGAGIPVDRPVASRRGSGDDDPVLDAAARGW